jgi:beta-glucosidase
VQSLAVSYAKGLLDAGIVVCAKHFIGDGSVQFGTGEGDNIIDRGNANLTDEQLQLQLAIYQALIDEGVQTVMISHSSLNGVKMHENDALINGVLKEQMGFSGFVVSDWESIHNISGSTLKKQVIKAVNAGIDMLMEPEKALECADYIIEAVGEGSISLDRVNDAVLRIVRVKLEAGLFDDPMQTELTTSESAVGGENYRALAAKLVEESLVLLKNEGGVLPLKQGASILVFGPAADQTGVYCGGWTKEWLGVSRVQGGSTILDGFNELKQAYGLKILTDPAKASEADVIVLCIGETSYAEWLGDAEDMNVTGALGLPGAQESIELAKQSGKPVVACIVAGRNVLISDYMEDWDAIVMCYLPGTEAKAIASVLTGEAGFSGKLAMPWYDSIQQIDNGGYFFPVGYGLTY